MSEAPSMLDLNMNDVYETEMLPDGEEQELRVAKAEMKEKKKVPGEFQLVVILEDPSNDKIDDIWLYMGVPTVDERQNSPKTANRKMQRIQQFYDAFDIDYSQPVMMADLQGQTGWAVVGIQAAQDSFPEKNYVKSFTVKAA